MLSRSFISKGLLVALLALGVLAAGCGQGDGYALSEQDEPAFRKGENLMRENRLDEAMISFESVVDARRDCPESHLELGRIYMDHVKDPIAAIYHFRKFLELRPDSETAKQVTMLIESAKKDFARSLPGDPFGDTVDHMDVYDQLKKVRAENDELKRSVASLQDQLRGSRPRATADAASGKSAQQAASQQRATAGQRSYTVQAGDTLSKISQAVYGTNNRWQDIFNANRNQLKSAHDLKVGMVLTIP